MNTLPAISIIIPVYNAGEYLKECLESILLQSFSDFELILIDDHSTDTCAAIISEASERDTRIRYTKPESKVGPGEARNIGISLARGKYICFADADDTLSARSLETRFRAMESHGSDVVYAGSHFHDGNEITYIDVKTKNPRINISLNDNIGLFSTLTHGHCACFFLKDFLIKNECRYGKKILAQDMCFLLSVLFSNPRITIIPDIVYNYRIHQKSRYNSKKNLEKVKALFYPYEYIFELDHSEGKIYAYYFVKNRLANPKDLLFLLDLNRHDRFLIYSQLQSFISKNNIISQCIESTKNKRLEAIKLPSHVKFIVKNIAKKNFFLADFSLHAYAAKLNKKGNIYTLIDDIYINTTKMLKNLVSRKSKGAVKSTYTAKLDYDNIKREIAYTVARENEKLISEMKEQVYDIIECLDLYTIPPDKKSVLIVEAENWHAEVLPGYCKYFLDLGYSVTVITGRKNYGLNPLARIHNDRMAVYTLSLENTKKLLSTRIVKRYEYLVFTTRTFIIKGEDRTPVHVFDYMPNLVFPQKRIFTVEHHYEFIERAESIRNNETVIIPGMHNPKDNSAISVNPHFFGDVKYPPKNAVTKFISIGNFEKRRRNMNLLFSSIAELYNSDVKNFEVILVSRDKLTADIPNSITHFIQYHYMPSFNTMLTLIEGSDFILPLLDPDIEDHNRYLSNGTSGTFQLIYGFSKPCIINEKFAASYGIDENNSILYSKNDDFSKKMLKAITMPDQDYLHMRENMKQLTEHVYTKSFSNLKSQM